ncbi:MAG: (d)CMP kinase, partial [Thermoanaerobaculia bacterium]
MIVAIDGPSGAGKSTVARALAERLGVPYIDTGAMYRAVGLAAREAGVELPIADAESVVKLAEEGSIGLEPGPSGLRVLWNGRDVSESIRQPDIS